MAEFFDVVFVADPRFSGGTSTALAAEIRAARQAGLSAGLLPVMGPVLRKAWPVHPAIAAAIEAGDVAVIARGRTVRTTFAILHHPGLFTLPPAAPLGLLAETAVLVLHHPPRDGAGAGQYDLAAVLGNIRAALGLDPVVAPVGPLVRRQLDAMGGTGMALLAEDWTNLIDVADWPDRAGRPVGSPVRIGRHSRPLPQKWPATRALALAAYPDREGIEVSMLGADPERLGRVYGTLPGHWRLLPFGAMEVSEYLDGLDLYVYFHAPEWVEAFGRSILEAAACGLVILLPAHFEPVFGPAAIYCKEEEVADLVAEFAADPKRHALQSARARAHVARSFGLDQFGARLARLRPDWAALKGARPQNTPRPGRKTRQVALLMTSNGVGLGHLTRMLALADEMPPELEPVFFTLSHAADLARQAGYAVEFRPFHRATGADIAAWNRALAEELSDAIAFHGPAILVFDGNTPYQGLCDALAAAPDLVSIWMRRAFWTAGHARALERSGSFDAVIEPADLAEILDHGPTVARRDDVHRVPPVLRGDPGALHEREPARRILGLPAEGTLALVSLGGQANYDLSPVLAELRAWADGRPDVTLVHLVPWIGARPEARPGEILLERYPVFPLMRAFDFQISTCGYNAFHEAMLGAIPTVFVPNEAAEMDLQIERARYGALAGASLTLRRAQPLAAARVLDRIADPQARLLMQEAARRLPRETGAAAAARFVCDYAQLRKTAPR